MSQTLAQQALEEALDDLMQVSGPKRKEEALTNVRNWLNTRLAEVAAEARAKALEEAEAEAVYEMAQWRLADDDESSRYGVEACQGVLHRISALKTKGEKCEGCDKPKEGPHRFSCSVAGKRQVVLSVNLTEKP